MPTRQKHVSFKVERADFTTDEQECQCELVLRSVADQSRYQYWSRLNTLCRYIRARRGLPVDAPLPPWPPQSRVDLQEAVSCTRAEFLGFLKSWCDQSMGDPENTRSALLLWQRAWGIAAPFTEEECVRKAVEGAAGQPGPDKLVLDDTYQAQYEQFLMNGETVELGPCRGCRMNLETVEDRELLVHASRFIKQVPCRLHNLREFEVTDLLEESGEAFVKHMKTCKGGPGYVPYDLVAQTIVSDSLKVSKGRFKTFLFPTCIQKHLTASIKSAGAFYGWEDGLVHTGYCLRHTGMRNRKKKIEEAAVKIVVNTLLAEESACSAQNANRYARGNEKRRKRS